MTPAASRSCAGRPLNHPPCGLLARGRPSSPVALGRAPSPPASPPAPAIAPSRQFALGRGQSPPASPPASGCRAPPSSIRRARVRVNGPNAQIAGRYRATWRTRHMQPFAAFPARLRYGRRVPRPDLRPCGQGALPRPGLLVAWARSDLRCPPRAPIHANRQAHDVVAADMQRVHCVLEDQTHQLVKASSCASRWPEATPVSQRALIAT
jgi:hypothetical protein